MQNDGERFAAETMECDLIALKRTCAKECSKVYAGSSDNVVRRAGEHAFPADESGMESRLHYLGLLVVCRIITSYAQSSSLAYSNTEGMLRVMHVPMF